MNKNEQSVQNQGTIERERKLHELKLKLIATCCQSLLNPPLPFIGALRFDKDDTEEDKDIKRKEHARKAMEREEERILREPELLRELEKIMERVRSARRYLPLLFLQCSIVGYSLVHASYLCS